MRAKPREKRLRRKASDRHYGRRHARHDVSRGFARKTRSYARNSLHASLGVRTCAGLR